MRKVTLDKRKFIKRDHFAQSISVPASKQLKSSDKSGEWSISDNFDLDVGYDTLVFIEYSSPNKGN